MMNPNDDQRKLEERYRMMTQAPVRRLILKMAVPTIISMLVTSIYNLVDSFFVGHLSTEAVAGVGVAFAYMAFINACGFFFGHGSGNYISRALGARNAENAGKMAATGFVSPLILGTMAGMTAFAFSSSLSRALGSTEQILPSANAYLRYIFLATPFMMSSLTMNNQLRLQGNARFGMIGIASGAILNIALDPLFIFVLDMGVSGASLATAVSQCFGWCVLLWGTSREGNVHIRLRNFTPIWEYYQQIIRGGLPSLARQALAVVATICLNRMAVHYADPGNEASVVAAFSIVTRVMMMCFAVIIGLGQGFQPVCGYNYGAKLYHRVKESYLFCITLSTAVLIVLATLGYLFAPDVIALFRSEDPELIRVGSHAMRWQCIAFPLMGLSTTTNMLLQNINYTWQATFLSMCRQGICFLPAVFIAPWLWGLTGLEAAQAIADAMTFLISLPFAIQIIRELSAQEKNL